MLLGMRASSDASVYSAIASDARRRVLELLRDGERPVGEIVAVLAMSQPAVSQHLAVLRSAGLAEERRRGRQRVYRLRAEPLAEVAAWAEAFRRFWEQRLDALGAVLDEMTDPIDSPDPAVPAAPTASEEDP
jgi:DNA-binding transcriptional ArsR family regulator